MQKQSMTPRENLILEVILNSYLGVKHSGFIINTTLDQNYSRYVPFNAHLELICPGLTKSRLDFPNFLINLIHSHFS